MLARRLVVSTLALGFLVWVPTAAHAQSKMVMSGKHRMYCCDTPPFAAFQQPAKGAPYGYGAGNVLIYNTVSATGVSNKTLLIKSGQIGANADALMATPATPKFLALTSKLHWYNGKATLEPGGSWPTGTKYAGSTWSFCPIANGPGAGSCLLPISATGTNRNGRILRKALSPNKFGGTMKLIGGSKSKSKRLLSLGMTTYILAYPSLPDSVIGVTPAAGLTSVKVKNYINKLASPTSAKIPNPAYLSFRGAGPWGTGYAAVQVTMNGLAPLVTVGVTGSDTRTSMGFGNLQLVSGELFNGINVKGTVDLGNVITVALPEPEPALGVAASAVGLMLLGLFRARRRQR